MDKEPTTLERAFQMASSGKFATINGIIVGLRQEGFASEQVDGASLRKQLRAIIEKAKHAQRT